MAHDDINSDCSKPFLLGRVAEVWGLISADGHTVQFASSLAKNRIACPRSCGCVLKLPVVPHQGVEAARASGPTLLDVTSPLKLEDRLRLNVIEQLVQQCFSFLGLVSYDGMCEMGIHIQHIFTRLRVRTHNRVGGVLASVIIMDGTEACDLFLEFFRESLVRLHSVNVESVVLATW